MLWLYLALSGALLWAGILLLPWCPWRAREVLDAGTTADRVDLSDITALIPARNEAETIQTTLAALGSQGAGIKTVLIDDQSHDGTAQVARATGHPSLRVVSIQALPAGWSGKLWALEQGRAHVDTPLTLLLDADIALCPGILPALRDKMKRDGLAFVSLMAMLRMQTAWEKLLMPAFVYFFRLLYPFHLSNKLSHRHVAAAAGGCILLKTHLIDEVGGFQALRDAMIDDCALARRVKALGYKTWLGLTHSVRSIRAYNTLAAIWNMVARSAFTQLRCSIVWLLVCTAIFVIAFWLPVAGLVFPSTGARLMSVMALGAMILSYIPTLRFYGRSPAWSLAMPLIGTLYLAMTWTSAMRYWRGRRSYWKERIYTKTLDLRSR